MSEEKAKKNLEVQDLKEIPADEACEEFHIVGIGASAGGLEAIESLFEEMPLDTGMAFVIVQHLSPDFKSHMEELLARKTEIPIHRVVDGIEVEPNSIYLIPAKKEMVISGQRLRLTERSRERTLSHPIDQFFRSLANDAGKFGIGIILSGTGSDGSKGVQDLKQAGGLVLAQDEQSAKFDGMPLNAVATGDVDLVLPPQAMPKALTRYVHQSLSPEALAREELATTTTGVDKIFELLRRAHGVDFSHYKASTVGRRVQRRMQLHGFEEIEDYCTLLEKDAEELESLYKDLLIGVTELFRDRKAFEFLETEVFPELLAKARETGHFRVWVAGCASGEEAYSIAILVDEGLRREKIHAEVKIFATDIHHGSLAAAGAGLFSEAKLQKLSTERRERYFKRKKEKLEVVRSLRNMVVFASHNVFNDAPFTQLDLITCRNLLIYLQPIAQKKALSLFHFGLRAGGALFLGSSETPGELSEEFETLSGRWRLYRKRRDVRLPIESRLPFSTTSVRTPTPKLIPEGAKPSARESQWLAVYDRLLDMHMPTSLLLDEDRTLLHVFGGAERYLGFRGGRQSSDVLDLIDESLKTPLAGALQHAVRENTEVRYTGLSTSAERGREPVRLLVRPLHDPRTNVLRLLVTFVSEERGTTTGEEDRDAADVDLIEVASERLQSLETELRFTRENLQATIEELETSNEELQAANEEMLASNEELQSTNEELQSVNEELYTVNTEHQKKIEELTRAHDDMDNLLALTLVGVIFLDEDLAIRRFTPEMGRLFHLMPQDIGRSFESFEHNLAADGIRQKLEKVVAEAVQIEERVEDRQGNPFLMRMAPYRRADDFQGVVLTLVDIGELEKTQRDLVMYQDMAEQAADMLFLVRRSGEIRYANPASSRQTGFEKNELLGEPLRRIVPSQTSSHLRRLFEDTGTKDSFESELERRDGTRLPVGVTANPVRMGSETLLLFTARDITHRKAAEQRLTLYHSAIDATMNGVTIADARQPDFPLIYVNDGFTKITGYSGDEILGKNCRLLQGADTDPQARQALRRAVETGEHQRVTIENYRKDGTPFWNDVSINPVRDSDGEVTHFVGIQNDVTEAIDGARLALAREARLSALLNSTLEGILGIDPAGRCMFSNSAALQMLGRTREQVVGRTLAEIVGWRQADGAEPDEALTKLEGSEPAKLDGQKFRRGDGTFLPVDVSIQPISQEEQLFGTVITFEDTTERALQEERLDRARQEADAANQTKSQFLANMSHEIRTPLAAVMAFADLLRMHVESAKEKEFVDGIDRNARALLDIVNDILDLSKVEANRLEMHFEEVNIPDLLFDIRSAVGIRAAETGLDLSFECTTPIPITIRSDRSRLRQILLNLVGNALKFTERGEVRVEVGYLLTARRLEISVLDTGIGIESELQQRLFEPFEQADPSFERRFGGTGLGLSITKKLVEHLGGRIRFESEVGQGSTFVVELPTGLGDEQVEMTSSLSLTTAEDRESSQTPSLEGHVLLVDNEEDLRRAVAALLRTVGLKVSDVGSGREALAFMDRHGDGVDAILLDLQMPHMSGFEVLDRLREKHDRVPVVAFTAQAMKGERERCLESGFTGYVTKPIDREELFGTLEELLDSRPPTRTVHLLLVEDQESAAQALQMLLAKDAREVHVARSGKAALSIAEEIVPQACLLDLGLPDMTGEALARRLRKIPGMQRAVLIALSGAEVSPDQVGPGRLFAHAMLKPVDIRAIEEILDQLVDRSA